MDRFSLLSGQIAGRSGRGVGKKWPVTEPPTLPTWTGTGPLQTMVVRILGVNKHSHWPRGVCKRSVKPLVWTEPPAENPYKTSKTECVAGVRTNSAAIAADGERSKPRGQANVGRVRISRKQACGLGVLWRGFIKLRQILRLVMARFTKLRHSYGHIHAISATTPCHPHPTY